MRYWCAFAALLIAGCAENAVSYVDMVKRTFHHDANAAVDNAIIDPKLRYLRITHDGGVALLLLNFVDRHPNGAVEVWYSGDAEVFRFQNGRIGGTTGMRPEWRSVALPKFPSWAELGKQSEAFHWERFRDVMPRYRFGIRDKLALYRVPTPQKTGLISVDPASLVWFEERIEPDSAEQLPPARYAVRGETVVYGEQCVSRQVCFKWQRWPPGS